MWMELTGEPEKIEYRPFGIDIYVEENWTNAEIENAKAIRRLFKEAKTLERHDHSYNNTESIKISSIQVPIFTNLDKNLFPSAKRHVVYYIDEIIKEGEY